MTIRSLTEGLPAEAGLYPVGDDAMVEILEPRREKRHDHIRSVWPAATVLETGFASGPVLAFRIEDAVADLVTGAIYDRTGALLREAFGTNALTQRHADQHPHPSDDAVMQVAESVLPLATTRASNYCRWWLDSMSKPFVVDRSRFGSERAVATIHGACQRFQREALALLDDVRLLKGAAPRFVRGTIVSSPGLTFGGGQYIGAMVSDFGGYLHHQVRTAAPAVKGMGKRIYISRRRALIRRVTNEPVLAAALSQEGVVTVELETVSLARQAAIFAEADVIVAPHGAGLTNLLWSRPGATLIEIFPQGGMHGSAFLRIASQLGLAYHAIVGAAGPNRDRRDNPNNADIELDMATTMPFIRAVLAKHDTA